MKISIINISLALLCLIGCGKSKDSRSVEISQFEYDEVIYDGITVAIVRKGDKFGGFEKESENVLPIIFERVDSYTIQSNLVKLNGKWGENENGTLNEIEDPVFIAPDNAAVALICKEDCGERVEVDNRCDCVKNKIMKSLTVKYSDYLKSATGRFTLMLTIDQSGEIVDKSYTDVTTRVLSDKVIEIVDELFTEWIPAEIGNKKVKSKVFISLDFNK